MSLIISEQASADFTAEGVSTSSVLSAFSNLTSCLSSSAILSAIDYSSYTDPSAPSDLTTLALALWNSQYAQNLIDKNTSSICLANLSSFQQIATLFSLTSNAPLSRQDVIEQLTETISSYQNTTVLTFLTDMETTT